MSTLFEQATTQTTLSRALHYGLHLPPCLVYYAVLLNHGSQEMKYNLVSAPLQCERVTPHRENALSTDYNTY